MRCLQGRSRRQFAKVVMNQSQRKYRPMSLGALPAIDLTSCCDDAKFWEMELFSPPFETRTF